MAGGAGLGGEGKQGEPGDLWAPWLQCNPSQAFRGLESGCGCVTEGSCFLLAVVWRPLTVPGHRAFLAWPLPSSAISGCLCNQPASRGESPNVMELSE